MNKEATTIYGIGRRKTAIAQVQLTLTPDEKVVNGMPFDAYFRSFTMRDEALLPLYTTSRDTMYGLRAVILGGGLLGQACALKLAIARALLSTDATLRKQLRSAGLLTRDPRKKERKKPGLKGARRAPQFSKR